MSLGNSITSIKDISRIDFLNVFEKINSVEEVLKKDPSQVYNKMDYKTKDHYRNRIKELSKATRISEIYIANKALDLAEKHEGKKAHIGYYLVSDGLEELRRELTNKKDASNSSKVSGWNSWDKNAKKYVFRKRIFDYTFFCFVWCIH